MMTRMELAIAWFLAGVSTMGAIVTEYFEPPTGLWLTGPTLLLIGFLIGGAIVRRWRRTA